MEVHYDLNQNMLEEKYLTLGIESNHIITAYECTLFHSKSKLLNMHGFVAYENPDDGQFYIARVQHPDEIGSYETDTGEETFHKGKKIPLKAIHFKKMDSITYTAFAEEK